jgi:hypothetical protein
MTTLPSLLRRREIIAALRNGTVPRRGLKLFAVGLGRFDAAIDEELERAALGEGVFKAVRGEYGTGKTFFSRWVQHRAQEKGFATSDVQISETETPLYRMETLYRRALENLRTREWESGAFRSLIDKWFFALEEEVARQPGFDPDRMAAAVGDLLEARLSGAPQPFATVLRACHRARVEGDHATSEALLGWLMGEPNVGAEPKRIARIKGEIDHFAASGFLRGLLMVLRDTGRKGLLLVLDEVETVQRMRADSREKSLNALRQIIDELDGGRYPGLYVMITGTPAFYDGPQGVRRLPPLEQRLHVDFSGDPRWESAKATQIRLHPFDVNRLAEVGRLVRDLYPAQAPERMATRVTDEVIRDLAVGVTGFFGGKVGVAPRIYLRKLIGEVLDKVDEHPDYDPAKHFKLVVDLREMTVEERTAAGALQSVDDIALEGGDESSAGAGRREID